MYLLDTNVISELRRPRPDLRVVTWLASVERGSTFVSVMTIGEITTGIAQRQRDNPRHAEELQKWLDDQLIVDYGERILPITLDIAKRWGKLQEAHPQLPQDMLLAATALEHHLTVATRNTRHLARSGVAVVNPFEYGVK